MSIDAHLTTDGVTITGLKPSSIFADGTIEVSMSDAAELADQLHECRRNGGGRESVVVSADNIEPGDVIENFGEVVDKTITLGWVLVATDQHVQFSFFPNYLITLNRRIS